MLNRQSVNYECASSLKHHPWHRYRAISHSICPQEQIDDAKKKRHKNVSHTVSSSKKSKSRYFHIHSERICSSPPFLTKFSLDRFGSPRHFLTVCFDVVRGVRVPTDTTRDKKYGRSGVEDGEYRRMSWVIKNDRMIDHGLEKFTAKPL